MAFSSTALWRHLWEGKVIVTLVTNGKPRGGRKRVGGE
jgi:hypothetical protein